MPFRPAGPAEVSAKVAAVVCAVAFGAQRCPLSWCPHLVWNAALGVAMITLASSNLSALDARLVERRDVTDREHVH